MTIAFTDNGSCCINDAAVEEIIFLREKKEVRIWPLHADMGPGMPFQTITDVQQVVYNVQAEPRAINDSCEEILDLRNTIHELIQKNTKLEKSNMILRAYSRKLGDNDPSLYDKIYEEIHKEFKEYFDEQDQSKPSD